VAADISVKHRRTRLMLELLVLVRLAWYLPLELLSRRSTCSTAIERDCLRARWRDPERPATHRQMLEALGIPGVRSVVYHRLETEGPAWQRVLASFFRRVWRASESIEILCPDIGPGLMLPHGFALVLHAQRIGRDCLILQGVTLGRRQGDDAYPTIGDQVEIGAGASILGSVRVGDGAIIGANAVVLTDVPAAATAVGVPARIRPGRARAAHRPRDGAGEHAL
jgi:serine O-acetyltransferase